MKNDFVGNSNTEKVQGLAAIAEIFSKIKKPFADIEMMAQMLAKVFAKLPKRFEETSQSLVDLADRGWYLPIMDVTPSFLFNINDILKKRGYSHVDLFLIDYYSKNSKPIIKSIIQSFPLRKKAISAAFKAHSRGDYYLSIPVFLTQIEGITKELTGSNIFRYKNKKTGLSPNIEKLDDERLLKLLLRHLQDKREFNRPQVKGMPSGLNRHDVLHGACTDYGTKINSFKILSLLIHVVDIFSLYPELKVEDGS